MFEPNSRYYNLETLALKRSDGEELTYKERRFLPRAEAMTLLSEVTVIEGDRLDLITARTLSDPEQFWRVADANNAMDPMQLTAEPGRRLRVAVPQLEGISTAHEAEEI